MPDTATSVHDRLRSKGLSEFAIAGIMGNLDAESGLRSNNLQNTFESKLGFTDEGYTAAVNNGTYTNFVNDRAGYGFAQWTYPDRKKGLLAEAQAQNTSIDDEEMQIDYLWKELNMAMFKGCLEGLKAAKSVKEASDIFLKLFERPASGMSKSAERAARAQKYYEMFNDSTTSASTTTTATATKKFTPRTTAPSTSSKFWLHTSKGGLNECILIAGASCLPNCVGYAWGRFYEITGVRPRLSKANAENWYGNTADGYKRSQVPALGAVICWAKGKVGNAADGAGHVAIVEEIKTNGDIVTSNSGYGSTRFYMQTITKKSGYSLKGYTFQGFILPPDAIPYEHTTTSIPTSAVPYTVKVSVNNLNIRTEPSNQSPSKGYIKPGIYTIVEEKAGPGAKLWGRLKSGQGWIALDYAQKT